MISVVAVDGCRGMDESCEPERVGWSWEDRESCGPRGSRGPRPN